MASLVGIPVNKIIAFTFILGSALAAIAGVMFSMYNNVLVFDAGYRVGLKAFTAAILGGIGNIPGAVLGAMIIGLTEALTTLALRQRMERRDHLRHADAGAAAAPARPARRTRRGQGVERHDPLASLPARPARPRGHHLPVSLAATAARFRPTTPCRSPGRRRTGCNSSAICSPVFVVALADLARHPRQPPLALDRRARAQSPAWQSAARSGNARWAWIAMPLVLCGAVLPQRLQPEPFHQRRHLHAARARAQHHRRHDRPARARLRRLLRLRRLFLRARRSRIFPSSRGGWPRRSPFRSAAWSAICSACPACGCAAIISPSSRSVSPRRFARPIRNLDITGGDQGIISSGTRSFRPLARC